MSAAIETVPTASPEVATQSSPAVVEEVPELAKPVEEAAATPAPVSEAPAVEEVSFSSLALLERGTGEGRWGGRGVCCSTRT